MSEDGDESDRMQRRVLWSLPTGLYVVGSRDGDRRNGMTLNQATQVSSEPRIVAIAVLKEAFTAELIHAGQVFSINLLARSDSAMVRKFVKPVAVDLNEMTLNGFAFSDGVTGAPILDAACSYIDCRVVETLSVGNHDLFLGLVEHAVFRQPEDTPVLRMEDTRMKYGG
jgi:flavin reductase (DIM6/NTAB) family NADH-FMN oxidoreductase RutF